MAPATLTDRIREIHAKGGFNDPRLTNRHSVDDDVIESGEAVFQGQMVHFYESPSTTPILAQVIIRGLAQDIQHKVLLLVFPPAGSSTDHVSAAMPKLVYAHHRDNRRRKDMNESHFWDWHPHDPYQRVESLKEKFGEIDTLAADRIEQNFERRIAKLEETNTKLINEIRGIKARAARAAKKSKSPEEESDEEASS